MIIFQYQLGVDLSRYWLQANSDIPYRFCNSLHSEYFYKGKLCKYSPTYSLCSHKNFRYKFKGTSSYCNWVNFINVMHFSTTHYFFWFNINVRTKKAFDCESVYFFNQVSSRAKLYIWVQARWHQGCKVHTRWGRAVDIARRESRGCARVRARPSRGRQSPTAPSLPFSRAYCALSPSFSGSFLFFLQG